METQVAVALAVARLRTGLRYGPDMVSSLEVCVRDAIALLQPTLRLRAKVKWFNDAKGYGFVEFPGEERPIFAHYSAIHGEGFKTLAEGQDVEIELIDGPKGPQCAAIWKLSYTGEVLRCVPTPKYRPCAVCSEVAS